MAGSPPQSRGTFWLVAVVLLLLGVAGVITLISIDPDPRVGGSATGSPSPTPGDRYGPVPELCDMTDLFGPVFDILPQVGLDYDRESSDGPYQRDCVFRLSDGDAFGHLNAYAAFDTSVEDARNWYRDLSGSAAGLTPLAENLDADWDEGVVLLAEESNGADVQLLARDGVLVLKLSFYLTGGDAADPEAQQAALVTVADGIREAMRR